MSGRPPDELSLALRHLHRRAGEPSTREIGKAISYSHTTVSHALNGSRCPSWRVVERIVGHLGGDVEEFRLLWLAVRETEDPLPPLPVRRADQTDSSQSQGPSDSAEQLESGRVASREDQPIRARLDINSGTLDFIVTPRTILAWIRDLREKGAPDDKP